MHQSRGRGGKARFGTVQAPLRHLLLHVRSLLGCLQPLLRPEQSTTQHGISACSRKAAQTHRPTRPRPHPIQNRPHPIQKHTPDCNTLLTVTPQGRSDGALISNQHFLSARTRRIQVFRARTGLLKHLNGALLGCICRNRCRLLWDTSWGL